MLVTKTLQREPRGGRELLCRLNHDALAEILAEGLCVAEVHKSPVAGWQSVVAAFGGHIDGISDEAVAHIVTRIRREAVDTVFVDGSNLGEVVRQIKRSCPGVRVYTFFHNVEARFFLGSLRERVSVRALGVLLANYLAERKAVRFSDRLIALSERDSRLLGRLYGRQATDIFPMALREPLSPAEEHGALPPRDERFALFVGGAFYANRAGIAWYARHVAPRVHIRTFVVGRGFECLAGEMALGPNIQVVGEVRSVATWYRRAHFVVAPIFDGSGMKTKVAEALMYGKKIIGTPESFSGYEDIAPRAGRICATADDFVRAIEAADSFVGEPCDPELRAAFESRYSFAAAKRRLQRIMDVDSAEKLQ